MLLYDLKNKKNVEKTHIVRSLFGYKDKSNNGKYSYKREGLFLKFDYKKLNKSVVVVDAKDAEKVRKILRKFGLNVLIMNLPTKQG